VGSLGAANKKLGEESDTKKTDDKNSEKLYNVYLSAAFSVFVFYLNFVPNPFNQED